MAAGWLRKPADSPMKTILIAVTILMALLSSGQQALKLNARTLAADPANPNHIMCGTVDGKVWTSFDSGKTWSLFTDLGAWSVVSRIIFTKDAMLIGTWNAHDPKLGSVWRWKNGQWDRPYIGSSVRAFATYHNLILVGTLSGVFSSRDDGDTWNKIGDIENVDSIALDGKTIYVGTFHLAYKSRDAGKTWTLINHGVANDSDIMSILADDGIVYLSACSGVYKSENAGKKFVKMRGIPNSSRRTHVLTWRNNATVYAGTTEGLWETMNGGKAWGRVSDKNLVINDILITHDGVLLAVDREGVLFLK